jgi:hypothetical protein
LRGAKDSDGNLTHLLAAMTHDGLVIGQVDVGRKPTKSPWRKCCSTAWTSPEP